MAEIRIGSSPLTGNIIAAEALGDGTFGEQYDVTNDAIAAVMQYLLKNKKSIGFTYENDGKLYKLQVAEVRADESSHD